MHTSNYLWLTYTFLSLHYRLSSPQVRINNKNHLFHSFRNMKYCYWHVLQTFMFGIKELLLWIYEDHHVVLFTHYCDDCIFSSQLSTLYSCWLAGKQTTWSKSSVLSDPHLVRPCLLSGTSILIQISKTLSSSQHLRWPLVLLPRQDNKTIYLLNFRVV